MFKRIKRLYLEDKIDDIGLENAIQKGWITKEQVKEIKISIQ